MSKYEVTVAIRTYRYERFEVEADSESVAWDLGEEL